MKTFFVDAFDVVLKICLEAFERGNVFINLVLFVGKLLGIVDRRFWCFFRLRFFCCHVE